MNHTHIGSATGVALVALCCTVAAAEPLSVTIRAPQPATAAGFKMGESRSPDGRTITVDSRSLRLDGRPWTPVMGEFHYARYPETEWREELLKMKAGGLDIVATYVFWIHHEEVEGQFDWSGSRSLRRFIETARDAGLKAIVRCGPWDHGEVRNGGFPDWLVAKGWRLRSDDPNYLAKARILYAQIADQLKGLLWKDGGPVIGIQFENEYGGPAAHLLTLKRIARELGLDVPIYTRTGWPAMRTPMPFGEILPLYGVYAEGFWDRELTAMPGQYWTGFHFSLLRSDSNIANELLGRRAARDANDVSQYPYLTCEIGGGMMTSYHRRILVYPEDIEATTLVKLGSGSNSPGYYMYHGGTNPDGRLTTLMECQATPMTNWNDLPVKTYDFQAPLGEYGQIRPQYHLLRRLHLFLGDFGPSLAAMAPVLPDARPAGKDDLSALRWCVRSDGRSGLVFVNNYQRLQPMPAKREVQFTLNLPSAPVTFPDEPVTIPGDARFFWPFNFDLGHGVQLAWATCQPICTIDQEKVRTVFFAQTSGVPARFAFSGAQDLKVLSGQFTTGSGLAVVRNVRPDAGVAMQLSGADGSTVQIVLLDEASSLALWKGRWLGRERVFLTEAGLVLDGNDLRLTSSEPSRLSVAVMPAPAKVTCGGDTVQGVDEGVFRRFTPQAPRPASLQAEMEAIQPAGPPRKISMGKISQPVAAEPNDADFEKAAVWRIKLPADLDLGLDPVLRIRYVGDVGRVTLNGRLITDNFYNGTAFDLGLRRHSPEILKGDLRIAVLPLAKDAPIYMADEARPDFGKAESVVRLDRVEIVPRYQTQLAAQAGASQDLKSVR
jgi:beta-galactosidase